MKVIAWFTVPFLMLAHWYMEDASKKNEDVTWMILLTVPLAMVQIAYWFLLFNTLVIIGLM